MLEEKQGQFWNLHRIPNKTSYPGFRFFLLFCCFFHVFSGLKISNCNFIWKSSIIEKRRKSKIRMQIQDASWCRFQNSPCFSSSLVSFWLIFFWRFKNAFYRRDKYVYICIYWLLLGGFYAINASNQRTICSCMIFQPSCLILYFIFSINSIVFYEIFYNDVTASRDVTYLFTDPDKICTAYVKLNSKHILFMRIFWFTMYFSR